MFVLGLVLLQERQRQQSFDGNGYLFEQYLLIFLILAIATWRVTTQARGVVTLHVDLVSGCLFAARAGLQELTMTYKTLSYAFDGMHKSPKYDRFSRRRMMGEAMMFGGGERVMMELALPAFTASDWLEPSYPSLYRKALSTTPSTSRSKAYLY